MLASQLALRNRSCSQLRESFGCVIDSGVDDVYSLGKCVIGRPFKENKPIVVGLLESHFDLVSRELDGEAGRVPFPANGVRPSKMDCPTRDGTGAVSLGTVQPVQSLAHE